MSSLSTSRICRAVVAMLLAAAALTSSPAQAAEPQPTTSPSLTRHTSNGAESCPTGALCAYVLSNSGSHLTYYYFRFVHCRTYYLSHWHHWVEGDSYVIDNQTGGVTTTLYGRTGNVVQRFTPKRNVMQYVKGVTPNGGWEPVWSIRVC